MLDRSPRHNPVLDALSDAYARGDTPRGDHLLTEALDLDLPWDQVCAAAAAGVTRHFAEQTAEPQRA